jgi:hypothetical protein
MISLRSSLRELLPKVFHLLLAFTRSSPNLKQASVVQPPTKAERPNR